VLLWANRSEIGIGKHKTTGNNLQAITDQSGNIVVIFKPHIGSVYDLTTLHETGMLDVLDPKHLAADKDSWRQV
jgi:hypothetical protein